MLELYVCFIDLSQSTDPYAYPAPRNSSTSG